MQVIVNHLTAEKKTIPCNAAKLVKVYGETMATIHKDNILEIEVIDKLNGEVLSNPIIQVFDKGKIAFSGDLYYFLKRLKR